MFWIGLHTLLRIRFPVEVLLDPVFLVAVHFVVASRTDVCQQCPLLDGEDLATDRQTLALSCSQPASCTRVTF